MTKSVTATPILESRIPAEVKLPITAWGDDRNVKAPNGLITPIFQNLDLLTLGLDQSGTPLLLLAADGDIQHINCAARNMLDRSSIFGFRHNKIHIRRKEETAAFLRAVQSMGSLSTRAQATSTIVNLHSREGCIVASLLMRSLISRGFAGLIILRIADFTSRPTRHITWIADIFGLTPTESKIANGLLEGLTINDIAVREGNAVDTVRGHVKRAMAKVSAHSQAQFVSMLMRAHMALVNPDTDDHAGAHWF